MQKKIIVLLMLISLLSGSLSCKLGVCAEDKTLPSGVSYDEMAGEIEDFVQEHWNTTAGMAVSVFDDKKTIYKNSFGYIDKEQEIAVDGESVFEWGSASKLLVWVSVMQLWEQGKIDLDRDIRDYLPQGFLRNLNYEKKITMINLMNHQGGFQELYINLFVQDRGAFSSLEECLHDYAPFQIYEPGTVTAYSNWGVALAAYIVERISGQTFAEYVQEHIFWLLEMNHTAVYVDLSDNSWVQQQRKNLQCYTTEGELISDCFYYITLYPAGMCTSTLEDFETFAKALLKEESVLFQSADTRQELFTPTQYYGDTEIPQNCHGFWMVPYGVETLGHGGNTAGCSSYLLLQPEDSIGVVVMTNQAQEKVYNQDMMKLIFGEFQEENYFDNPRETPQGIYRSARTIGKGPFKFMSLSYESGEDDREKIWMKTDDGGIEKISYPYEDSIRIPAYTMVWEIGLVLFWLLAVFFALVSIFIKAVGWMVRKVKKQEKKTVLGIWSSVACLLEIALLCGFAVIVIKVSSYALAGTYLWLTGVIFALGVAMMGFALYGVVKLVRVPPKKARVYLWTVVVTLLISVVNIWYWNLYMFWCV